MKASKNKNTQVPKSIIQIYSNIIEAMNVKIQGSTCETLKW
jgi:hypothetical protein